MRRLLVLCAAVLLLCTLGGCEEEQTGLIIELSPNTIDITDQAAIYAELTITFTNNTDEAITDFNFTIDYYNGSDWYVYRAFRESAYLFSSDNSSDTGLTPGETYTWTTNYNSLLNLSDYHTRECKYIPGLYRINLDDQGYGEFTIEAWD